MCNNEGSSLNTDIIKVTRKLHKAISATLIDHTQGVDNVRDIVHRKTHVSATTEAEVEALKLAHKCVAGSRTFPTQLGLKIHAARWCDGGVTQHSRRGPLADRTVQTAKRREVLLSQVYVVNTTLENVYSVEYLGARMQCDGADDADVCSTLIHASEAWMLTESVIRSVDGFKSR